MAASAFDFSEAPASRRSRFTARGTLQLAAFLLAALSFGLVFVPALLVELAAALAPGDRSSRTATR